MKFKVNCLLYLFWLVKIHNFLVGFSKFDNLFGI